MDATGEYERLQELTETESWQREDLVQRLGRTGMVVLSVKALDYHAAHRRYGPNLCTHASNALLYLDLEAHLALLEQY